MSSASPRAREAEAGATRWIETRASVWEDVVDGLITPERAREVYGVVLGPEGLRADELKLDEGHGAAERGRKAASQARTREGGDDEHRQEVRRGRAGVRRRGGRRRRPA